MCSIPLLLHSVQDNVRQDHLTTKASFVRMVNNNTRVGMNFFAPRVSIQNVAESSLTVKEAEYDLVPPELIQEWLGSKRTLAQLRLPVVEFTRLNGTVIKGCLVWAEHWNATPGIPRIYAKEVFSAKRIVSLADSNTKIYDNEVDDAWKQARKDSGAMQKHVAPKKAKANEPTFDMPTDWFCPGKNSQTLGIFKDMATFKTAIQNIDRFISDKERERKIKEETDDGEQDQGKGKADVILSTDDGSFDSMGCGPDMQSGLSAMMGFHMGPKAKVQKTVAKSTVGAKAEREPDAEPLKKVRRLSGSEQGDRAANAGSGDVGEGRAALVNETEKQTRERMQSDLGDTYEELSEAPLKVQTGVKPLWELILDLYGDKKIDSVKENKVEVVEKKLLTMIGNKRYAKMSWRNRLSEVLAFCDYFKDIVNANQACIKMDKAMTQNNSRKTTARTELQFQDAVVALNEVERFGFGFSKATKICAA